MTSNHARYNRVISNTKLAAMPGNVFLPAAITGLDLDSVVNVTALATVGRDMIRSTAGAISPYLLTEVDTGIRGALAF